MWLRMVGYWEMSLVSLPITTQGTIMSVLRLHPYVASTWPPGFETSSDEVTDGVPTCLCLLNTVHLLTVPCGCLGCRV